MTTPEGAFPAQEFYSRAHEFVLCQSAQTKRHSDECIRLAKAFDLECYTHQGELLAMLRELEWSGPGYTSQDCGCPHCGEPRSKGPYMHAKDCRLDALLRRYQR